MKNKLKKKIKLKTNIIIYAVEQKNSKLHKDKISN